MLGAVSSAGEHSVADDETERVRASSELILGRTEVAVSFRDCHAVSRRYQHLLGSSALGLPGLHLGGRGTVANNFER